MSTTRHVASALALVLGATGCMPKKQGTLPSAVATFEKEHGVELHLVGVEVEGQSEDRRSNRLPAVEPAIAHRSITVIDRAMRFYGDDILGDVLQAIYVVGDLRRNGKPILGAVQKNGVSLDLAIRKRASPMRIQQTIHHEIAHLVEGKDSFPVKAWVEVSGRSAYKAGEHKTAWGKGGGFLRSGFMSTYGSMNRHEDFAEMAEVAFTRPDKARQLGMKYPKLRTKLELMADVYERLYPQTITPWIGEDYEAWKARQDRKARDRKRDDADARSALPRPGAPTAIGPALASVREDDPTDAQGPDVLLPAAGPPANAATPSNAAPATPAAG